MDVPFGDRKKTAVGIAVYGVLGGPTRAAVALELSGARIHQIVRDGYIPTRELAIRLSEICLERGQFIRAADLMALPEPDEMEVDDDEGSARALLKGKASAGPVKKQPIIFQDELADPLEEEPAPPVAHAA
jgi:hypothetical protein